MKLAILVGAMALGFVASASAQQAQEPFAPWTMTQEKSARLSAALGEVPAKYAVPFLQFLEGEEAAAQRDAAKAKKETEEHLKMERPLTPPSATPGPK